MIGSSQNSFVLEHQYGVFISVWLHTGYHREPSLSTCDIVSAVVQTQTKRSLHYSLHTLDPTLKIENICLFAHRATELLYIA